MKGLIRLLQLCCVYLKLVRPADVISPINCEIQNVAGFLQYVCPNSTHVPGFGSINVLEPRTFKCVNTDQLYRVGVWFAGGRSNAVGIVSHRCEKDPNFYQACSLRDLFNILNIDDSFTAEIHSGNFSCGYLCEIDDFVMGRMIFGIPNVKRRSYGSSGVSGNINRRFVCDGVKNCLNTDLDESQCGDSSDDHRCDLKCDVYPECLDESSCNGYNYGLWCENGTKYVRPFMVCDGSAWCSDWSDERACRVDDKVEFTCMSAITGAIIPLFNYTRCRPIAEYDFYSSLNVRSYCTDYLDQTNCSDYSRVGLYCLVKGKMSTIAHQVICFKENLYSTRPEIPSICDDSLDKACVDASLSCYLHKHLLCDGEVNCEDLSDESWYFCHHMTEVTCRRKYVYGTSGRSIAYPMAWIQDGVTDCWNGEDEDETWPTCGYGPTSRFVSWANEVCSEVFLCPKSDLFVEFDKMCDRKESCGNENQICEKSRHQFSTYQNVYRDDSNRVRLSYCLHGLKNCLVVLISFGDFLTGAYLTALASFDRYYGGEHCKLHLDWLVSTVCMLLGVVNSIGSQISLFSMTALSMIRAHGTLKSDFQISSAVSKRSVFKISIISFFIILLCFLTSYIPLLAVFEDYFVNGIKYENTLFLGCPGKNQHMTVLEKYYGRMRLAEDLLSWSQIRLMTGSMFSNDYGGIKQTTLSFYGNDPVCVFKFFVDVDDPQRNFSLAIISLNCICFIVIAGSYVAISASSRKSIRSLTNSTNEQNSAIQKTDARLQRVVLSLIISDFLCWIPFIIICWLHMFGVVDGNPWYRIFAILVLPINAVVNPVLYDKSTTRAIDAVVLWAVSQIRKILKKPIEIVEPAFELKNTVKNALANEVKCVEERPIE